MARVKRGKIRTNFSHESVDFATPGSGTSLLWAAFDLEWSERLSPEIKHRILSAFIRLERGVDIGNPVKIVEIIAMEGRNDAAPVLLVDKWANAIFNLTASFLPVTVYHS